METLFKVKIIMELYEGFETKNVIYTFYKYFLFIMRILSTRNIHRTHVPIIQIIYFMALVLLVIQISFVFGGLCLLPAFRQLLTSS